MYHFHCRLIESIQLTTIMHFQKGKIQLMITISLIAKTFANETCGERSKLQLFNDVKQKTIRLELCE